MSKMLRMTEEQFAARKQTGAPSQFWQEGRQSVKVVRPSPNTTIDGPSKTGTTPPRPRDGSATYLCVDLPWPPSANHFTVNSKNSNGRCRRLTDEARAYRHTVAAILRQFQYPILGRLELRIKAYPPDRRRRDIGNLEKQISDSLQHAGAFPDDFAIDRIIIERGPIEKGGRCFVEVREIG